MSKDQTLHRDSWLVVAVLYCLIVPQSINCQAEVDLAQTQKQTAKFPDKRLPYILGVDDQISVQTLDVDEISNKAVRIDSGGFIALPLVGKVRAAGLSTTQLEAEVASRLKTYIQTPQVVISVTEFRSQPVSVIGAVNSPGVHQLQGRKTLIEMLSMAGGLRSDAGHSVKITRRPEWGPIPLPSAAEDSTGNFCIAQVNLKSIMEAKNPEENILIQPNDVISVPRAEVVYVLGEVRKAGGFVLQERETLSVLEALALAEGLGQMAAPEKARILRTVKGAKPVEFNVDIKGILAGKVTDIALQPQDILFIPTNKTKKALNRTLDTAIGIGTGLIIYGPR